MKKELLLFCTLFIALWLTAPHLIISIGDAAPRDSSPLTCDPFNFAPAVNFWVDPVTNALAVGDFNGDGKKDILSTGSQVDENNPNRVRGSMSVLVGDGTGGFSAAATSGFSGEIYPLAVGDFNGDGRNDIAAWSYDISTDSAGVRILLGNEAGGFTWVPLYDEYYVYSIRVGDFNFDGDQDLAATSGAGTVWVLLGDGTGAFALTANPVIVPHAELAVGDFNADGNHDLVTPGSGQNVALMLSMGDGSFAPPVYFSAGGVEPSSIMVGDFNLDGNRDIVTANYSTDNVSVLLGNGAGSFGNATSFAAGDAPSLLALGDFDGDGNSDIAAGNKIILGNGSGGFGNVINAGLPATLQSLAFGDFNGDGRQDIAAANNGVSVFLAQCGIPTPTPTPVSTPTPVITPTPVPTPTPLVTVSGHVLTADGRGINRADVTMTDSANAVRETVTNQTGSFSFANVQSGSTYTFRASKKRVQFNNGTQTIFVTGEINNLTFNASP